MRAVSTLEAWRPIPIRQASTNSAHEPAGCCRGSIFQRRRRHERNLKHAKRLRRSYVPGCGAARGAATGVGGSDRDDRQSGDAGRSDEAAEMDLQKPEEDQHRTPAARIASQCQDRPVRSCEESWTTTACKGSRRRAKGRRIRTEGWVSVGIHYLARRSIRLVPRLFSASWLRRSASSLAFSSSRSAFSCFPHLLPQFALLHLAGIVPRNF